MTYRRWLRDMVETRDDQKKLRLFFSSFIDQIAVKDRNVRIEYRAEKLVKQTDCIQFAVRRGDSPSCAYRTMCIARPNRDLGKCYRTPTKCAVLYDGTHTGNS